MDWSIVVILVAFMVMSILLIHSAVATAPPKYAHLDKKMVINYILGFIAFFGMAFVNYRVLIKFYLYIFGAGILSLLFVKFFGGEVNGAQGWVTIPVIKLDVQPAELFKLILIITLSALLLRKYKLRLTFLRDVVPLSLVTFLPFALAMALNDIGNGLSYLVILLGMLWIGKMKYSHTLFILIILAVSLAVGIKSYVTYHDQIEKALSNSNKEHWLSRIDPWLLPEKASKKAVYHTKNASIAIASGGMFGQGYMKGAYTQTGRVPYTYADSIFVVAAEEFGFFGCSIMLLIYFIMIHRLILIALECRDRAGPLLIVGIVSMWLYQILENVGMFMGILPLTGITLPFISYGGSSLLINMACLGIAMSVKMHGQQNEDDLSVGRSGKAIARGKA
ncbi:rod shape determining protein RodA [Paenibacillus shirakamiensis]|uniref:Rod shape determining protein RodA n=2 Tax=Paenibacillus shirakamiensis TaxID=1265935 RepID=A0ABS4JL78_9BACL|nr:rod shape determining protein RodA [Paenibacillus shirakamiensis]